MNKQKGISTTLNILLITILIVIISGVLIYNYLNPVTGEPQYEMADWGMYRSEQYGFEIKHPGDVGVQQVDSPDITSESYRMFYFRTFYTEEVNEQMMSISVVPKNMEGFIRESLIIDTEKTIMINEIEGVRIIGSDQKGLSIDQIWINHNDKIYIIKKGDREDIFDQMLSTFSFLE